jgi:ribosomal protein S18 acetylase RimI-like enzyme
MSDDLKVGVLWLASREELNPGEWFVYDIAIDEPFRGKGFGRGTMQAAEEYVMSQGGKAIGLNVFGQNSVARNLYEAMDYRATAIIMKKHLS